MSDITWGDRAPMADLMDRYRDEELTRKEAAMSDGEERKTCDPMTPLGERRYWPAQHEIEYRKMLALERIAFELEAMTTGENSLTNMLGYIEMSIRGKG